MRDGAFSPFIVATVGGPALATVRTGDGEGDGRLVDTRAKQAG